LGDQFLIVGYLPEYRNLEPSWGNCLTDIIYFSAEPLLTGELNTSRFDPATLQALGEVKELYGTRLHISIGGYGRSENFGEMVTNSQARGAFVENLVQFAALHNLDGIDFDWEFPETKAEIQGYIELISETKQSGLIVSVALYPYDDLDLEPYLVADRVYIMSYERGAQHATFEQAVEDLDFFHAGGIPKEKLALGIPFYGRETLDPYRYFAYAKIVEQYHPPADVDEVDDIYFNGISTVQKKTCYTQQNGFLGVMIWELGQDSLDAASLLRAVYQAALDGCDS
jgi:hypothetical protein